MSMDTHDFALCTDGFDDDGHPKRTGTVWTACAHITTTMIGLEILDSAWSIAQLGWIAGPLMMFLFSFVIYNTSALLTECNYRSPGDQRNYTTYSDALRSSNLGGCGLKVKVCGLIQGVILFFLAIGCINTASISMMTIQRSNCFHENVNSRSYKEQPYCHFWSSKQYMMSFGVVEILLSQIRDFHQIWLLSFVSSNMSFTYSLIATALGIAKVAENGEVKGSLTGISIGGTITRSQKIWKSFQAVGYIAFAYSYSINLIEIQDTIRSPPSEAKTIMKKAILVSVAVTTALYIICGCMGYAAFGDDSPANLLTGFGFYNPFWLLDIANAAIIVQLVGAYQAYCQPLFSVVEKWAAQKWSDTEFMTKVRIPIFGSKCYKLNFFRFVWRSAFVVLSTIISMFLPFLDDILGIVGALGFWPLTVYFPVQMYIEKKRIPKWSSRWIWLLTLCLITSVVAAAASISHFVLLFKV